MSKSQAEVKAYVRTAKKNGINIRDGSLPGVKAMEVLINYCDGKLEFMKTSKSLFGESFDLCQRAIHPRMKEEEYHVEKIQALKNWDNSWKVLYSAGDRYEGREVKFVQEYFTRTERFFGGLGGEVKECLFDIEEFDIDEVEVAGGESESCNPSNCTIL